MFLCSGEIPFIVWDISMMTENTLINQKDETTAKETENKTNEKHRNHKNRTRANETENR